MVTLIIHRMEQDIRIRQVAELNPDAANWPDNLKNEILLRVRDDGNLRHQLCTVMGMSSSESMPSSETISDPMTAASQDLNDLNQWFLDNGVAPPSPQLSAPKGSSA